jgi:hypothetical protein
VTSTKPGAAVYLRGSRGILVRCNGAEACDTTFAAINPGLEASKETQVVYTALEALENSAMDVETALQETSVPSEISERGVGHRFEGVNDR